MGLMNGLPVMVIVPVRNSMRKGVRHRSGLRDRQQQREPQQPHEAALHDSAGGRGMHDEAILIASRRSARHARPDSFAL